MTATVHQLRQPSAQHRLAKQPEPHSDSHQDSGSGVHVAAVMLFTVCGISFGALLISGPDDAVRVLGWSAIGMPIAVMASLAGYFIGERK